MSVKLYTNNNLAIVFPTPYWFALLFDIYQINNKKNHHVCVCELIWFSVLGYCCIPRIRRQGLLGRFIYGKSSSELSESFERKNKPLLKGWTISKPHRVISHQLKIHWQHVFSTKQVMIILVWMQLQNRLWTQLTHNGVVDKTRIAVSLYCYCSLCPLKKYFQI